MMYFFQQIDSLTRYAYFHILADIYYEELLFSKNTSLELLKSMSETSIFKCEYISRLSFDNRAVEDTYYLIKKCGTYLYYRKQIDWQIYRTLPYNVLDENLLIEEYALNHNISLLENTHIAVQDYISRFDNIDNAFGCFLGFEDIYG